MPSSTIVSTPKLRSNINAKKTFARQRPNGRQENKKLLPRLNVALVSFSTVFMSSYIKYRGSKAFFESYRHKCEYSYRVRMQEMAVVLYLSLWLFVYPVAG